MSSVATLTAAHLDRAAYVYIRQSSEFQVQNHVERQRLQYAMADHAKELGFRDVEVIDDDLGISGAGVHRPGFDALLEAVCKGRVGLVLSIEASRLSRNGREWHTLLDFCAIVGCLVGDRDRLYDPALIDDRMYLGLKGQFNEMELAPFRQRSLESRMAMAQRGELFATLPAGYEKVERNRIEMTADQRQRDAIHLVFRKFRELGSIRQAFFWFHRNTVELPVRTPGQGLVWRVPTSSRRVAQILTNPIYAGAYAYGRRRQETVLDKGRKRVRRGIAKQDPQDWTVLLRDHHDGYITWDQFERNQELLSENMTKVRGAVRNGPELLTGVLRCGHCDSRIQVGVAHRSAPRGRGSVAVARTVRPLRTAYESYLHQRSSVSRRTGVLPLRVQGTVGPLWSKDLSERVRRSGRRRDIPLRDRRDEPKEHRPAGWPRAVTGALSRYLDYAAQA